MHCNWLPSMSQRPSPVKMRCHDVISYIAYLKYKFMLVLVFETYLGAKCGKWKKGHFIHVDPPHWWYRKTLYRCEFHSYFPAFPLQASHSRTGGCEFHLFGRADDQRCTVIRDKQMDIREYYVHRTQNPARDGKSPIIRFLSVDCSGALLSHCLRYERY